MSDQVKVGKIQLTQVGYDDVVQELKALEEVKLPEVIKRVETARGYGDLSENAEYHSAKEDQELTETRIADLKSVLLNATIVAHTKKTSTVGIGSKVTLHISTSKSKKKTEFTIVGDFEADPQAGKISSVSPIGKAIVGKKKGDVVKVNAPAGITTYEILEVK